MSVKFEKETTRTTAAVADAATKGKDDLMHEIGQAITKGGGPNGYLAVSDAHSECYGSTLTDRATGIPQAAAEQPIAHQDAYLGNPIWSARVSCIMDCA
jgi:hypothetical protein